MVKIAVHERRLQCVLREVGWYRRPQLQQYPRFLRASPGTNGANYAWPVYPTGSVSLGTFTVVSDVSYGRIIAGRIHVL